MRFSCAELLAQQLLSLKTSEIRLAGHSLGCLESRNGWFSQLNIRNYARGNPSATRNLPTHSQIILFLFTPFSKQVTARHCGRRQSAATFPYHAATAHLGVSLAPWEGSEVFWAGVSKRILNHKRKRFNLELPARFLNTSLSLVFLEAKGLKLHILVGFFCSLGLVYWLVSFELHFGSSHLDSQKGDCLE